MANPNWRNSTVAQTARVKTFEITATGGGTAVWTLTVTLDDNTTFTVTYTEDGSPTLAEVATGLYAAWLASTHPETKRITATNPSAGVLTLTAVTSGRPFTVVLADDGTGTHTETTSTAGVSNTDYAQTSNWSTSAVPTTGDNVTIGGPAGGGNAKSILYGLYQETVEIGAFNVLQEFGGDIGRIEDGVPFYLVVDPNSFDFRGSGALNLLNLTDAAIAAYIEAYGSPVAGRKALYLKGSALTTVEIAKGFVGLASFPNETATITTLLVGRGLRGDANVDVGSGVTLTTLTQNGAEVMQRCATDTTNVSGAAVWTSTGTGTIGTLNINGGEAYPESTGTVTAINLYGGLLDLTRDRSPRTVTTCNLIPRFGDITIRYGSWITFTNELVRPTFGNCRLECVG